MGNGMTKEIATQDCQCDQCGRTIYEGNSYYRDNSMGTWLKNFIPGGLGGDGSYKKYCSADCYDRAH